MKPELAFPKADSVDIALLLEGTYPFVRGGVSSWVHQLILGFPEYRFGVVFLGSEPSAYAGLRYELPANLVHLEAHYLYAPDDEAIPSAKNTDAQAFTDAHAMHQAFASGGGCPRHLLAKNAEHLLAGRLHQGHFQESRDAWEMITALYRKQGADSAFLDYFWTVRSMHAPIWALARVAQNLLPARCYHSASTGYAGFLGALLSLKHKRPFLLSEHGLYTKERKIDLMQSAWIRETGRPQNAEAPEGSTLRKLWIRFFESLGKAAYSTANPILSLYEGIRQQQIRSGAESAHTQCIPNGIALARYQPLRAKQSLPPKPIFSLIGRVVPIKDIKSFIRAMQIVKRRLPDAEGWIVGPGEEDPAYYEECLALTEALGLNQAVKFLGFQNVNDILPKTAILVLSSISEALPLTLLEGFAAGVPAVATDVGSCRQLILGNTDHAEDLALGAAGRVVGIGDATALAEAMIGLYSDSSEWERARVAAMSRVERFYTDTQMLARYRSLYQRALA